MGFGEEYQGMTDREILVDIAGKAKGMALMNAAQYAALTETVEELEKKVDKIVCPSPRCANHEKRITDQEQIEKDRKEGKKRIQVGAWQLILALVGSGLISAVTVKLMGG